MKRIAHLILFFIAYVSCAQGQAHVHGQGTAFIVQADNEWQVQYTLPASDALGFEHMPENQEQQATLSLFKQSIEHFESLMQFDSQCVQDGYSHNLSSLDTKEHEHHSHHDHTSHLDIEITYTIKCKNKVETINFSLFDKMQSLEKLEVQWSIENGQGFRTLSKSDAVLSIN